MKKKIMYITECEGLACWTKIKIISIEKWDFPIVKTWLNIVNDDSICQTDKTQTIIGSNFIINSKHVVIDFMTSQLQFEFLNDVAQVYDPLLSHCRLLVLLNKLSSEQGFVLSTAIIYKINIILHQ